MIKELKVGNTIYTNYMEKTTAENGEIVWHIPTNLTKFREVCLDTIKWQIGNNVKLSVKREMNLSVVNSKAIALVVKVLDNMHPDFSSGYTDLEKNNWQRIVALSSNGYSDSELLNNTLKVISESLALGTEKMVAISEASTIDEMITILNR